MRSITKKQPEIFFNIIELFDPYTAVPYTRMYNFTFLSQLLSKNAGFGSLDVKCVSIALSFAKKIGDKTIVM